MSERSLRGTQLGSRSLESDVGVEPAPRHIAEYVCEDGSTFTVPFSVEAEIPQTWESATSGHGILKGTQEANANDEKHVRTHWDMLLERRSPEELQALLDERLQMLRQGRLHQMPSNEKSDSGKKTGKKQTKSAESKSTESKSGQSKSTGSKSGESKSGQSKGKTQKTAQKK